MESNASERRDEGDGREAVAGDHAAVMSDGHAIAHQIEDAVDVVASIEEEMMLEAALIEDIEEH